MRAWLTCMIALLTAACGRNEDADQAARNFVPPVTLAPDALPGQTNATPLTAYVGRYPRDAVNGVAFFDRTEVANAFVDVAGDRRLRRLITGRDAAQVPIFRLGDRVAAHGCEPRNCGNHHWTVLIAANGDLGRAEMCHHQSATMGDTSRWTTRTDVVQRPGGCPTA